MKHIFEIILKVHAGSLANRHLGDLIFTRTLNVPFPMPVNSKIRTPEGDFIVTNLTYDTTKSIFLTTYTPRVREHMVEVYKNDYLTKGYSISPESTYDTMTRVQNMGS